MSVSGLQILLYSLIILLRLPKIKRLAIHVVVQTCALVILFWGGVLTFRLKKQYEQNYGYRERLSAPLASTSDDNPDDDE